jgi:N-acetylglucosamine-6-phosphate deacetylase
MIGAGVSLPEAVRMITATPAVILGLPGSKGMIKPAYDADIVIFDADIRIHSTIIKGEIVYENR